MVEARRGIEHNMPRGQLDPLLAELIVEHQFAAVIGVGLLQKERRGKVAADTEIAAAPDPHRTIDMRAERLAAFVAIEQRRKDLERQRGGDEQRRRGQRIEDDRPGAFRSEEHTSELQSLMRNSYAVFCLQK